MSEFNLLYTEHISRGCNENRIKAVISQLRLSVPEVNVSFCQQRKPQIFVLMLTQHFINHPRYFRLVYSNLKYEKQKEIKNIFVVKW